jgi:hypothetical protein
METITDRSPIPIFTRGVVTGLMLRVLPVILAVVCVFLLSGCRGCGPSGCNLNPTITVTADSSGTVLTISGSGFSPNTNPCANLGISLPIPPGVPSPMPQDVNCSGGSSGWGFGPKTVRLQYVGCIPNTKTSKSVAVSATDIKSPLCITFANVSIAWGPTCALAGTCGSNNLPACPNPNNPCPYAMAGVGLGVDGYGYCEPCGQQGQPACAIGSSTSGTPLQYQCAQGYHPQAEPNPNSQGKPQPPVVCTATCGWYAGAQEPCSLPGFTDCSGAPPSLDPVANPNAANDLNPCITQQNVAPNPQPINVYTCYGDSVLGMSATIGSGCICQEITAIPTPSNPCHGTSSGTANLCVPVTNVDSNCTQ